MGTMKNREVTTNLCVVRYIASKYLLSIELIQNLAYFTYCPPPKGMKANIQQNSLSSLETFVRASFRARNEENRR